MMTNAQLAAASFDDIVFDGRNKGYGAYQLRRLYQRHVSRALSIAISIFALLVFSPVVANYLKDKTPIAPPKVLVDAQPMVLPDEPQPIILPPTPPEPLVRATPPPVRTIKDTEFRVTRDVEAPDKVPDAAELLEGKLGPKAVEGPPAPATTTEFPIVEAPKELVGTVEDKPYISVEQMPELPGGGGVAAIVTAIQKAVRYPSRAISAGVEGKVYVSFVVNKLGEVTDVKVVKGLGAGLDEETIRAINTLPRFLPGRQNGQAVSVSYNVPITFKIQ